METLEHILRQAANWLFRTRTIAAAFIRYGVALIVASVGGFFAIRLRYEGPAGQLALDFDGSSSGLTSWLIAAAFLLGVGLVIGGVVWAVVLHRQNARRLARRRVVVIEQRGLGNTADSPLIDAVPETIEGTRDSVLVDIRERIKDGVVTAPEVALERVASLRLDIEKRITGLDRADVTVVYGGLLPVPFTFLSGLLLDDESNITTLDWDRKATKWRLLDGQDDGDRFTPPTVPSSLPGEAVLAISVSYQVDLPQVERVFPDLPLVHLKLDNRTTDGHWSEKKQGALAQSFLDVVKALEERGVKRIHLVLAAQNSVVFRFGRVFDKRNLPELVVYQYERSSNPAYPWGVLMPTHGVEKAKIVRPTGSGP